MTTVDLSVVVRGLGDSLVGTSAKVYIQAVSNEKNALFLEDDKVIFTKGVTLNLTPEANEAHIELKPTDGTFCYRWRITGLAEYQTLNRHTAVPDSTETIDFADLIDVDPKTFAPSEEATAAWEAIVEEVVGHRTVVAELTAETRTLAADTKQDRISAGSFAEASAGSASASDDSAKESLRQAGLANQSAGRASDSEGNASSSAGAAAESARLSEQSKVASGEKAEASRLSAVTAGEKATAARLDRESVDLSKTHIDGVKTDVDQTKVSVDQANARLNSALEDLSEANTRLAQIKSDAESISSDISQTQSEIGATQGQINDAKTAVDTAKSQVDVAKQAVDLAKSAVDTAKGQVDTTKSQVDQVKTDVTQLKTDVTQLKTDTDGFRSSAAQSASDANQSKIASAQSATDAQSARNETIVAVGTMPDWGTMSATLTQAATKSAYLKRRLTGNPTIGFAAGVANQAYSCTLELLQDGTGGRTITLVNVATPRGVPIPLTARAGAIDIIRLEWNGSRWAAFFGGDDLQIPSAWVV